MDCWRAGSRVASNPKVLFSKELFEKAAEAPNIEHFFDMNSVECSPCHYRSLKGYVDEEAWPGRHKGYMKYTVSRMTVVKDFVRGAIPGSSRGSRAGVSWLEEIPTQQCFEGQTQYDACGIELRTHDCQ